MLKSICSIALLWAVPAWAGVPTPPPTRDGRERIQRAGTCPAGYVGTGNSCEALHQDASRAYR
jgi:hypothetical protein